MLWLEMSRDVTHGGGSWDFTSSLWSPAYKRNADGTRGSTWAFWETLLFVRAGDQVLHLRGEGSNAFFVGFSTAQTNGFVTDERPPNPGQWGYANEFYRVLLTNYTSFTEPIALREIFSQQNAELCTYFSQNKARPTSEKKRLFYVIQAGRIQCLNGAYLSEVDGELAGMLLGSEYRDNSSTMPAGPPQVETAVRLRELAVRVGQQNFSQQVRSNYQSRCCFPDCSVSDEIFLIGAHIARWTDAPELRGDVANGLCFCLMHDKAFEMGLFTITTDFHIAVNVNSSVPTRSRWSTENLLPYDRKRIRLGMVKPAQEALRGY